MEEGNVLPQSSGNFGPEAHPELKESPELSEISIRRNFRKPHVLIRKKVISRDFMNNDPKFPTLDPERHFIEPGKIICVLRMTEVGRRECESVFETLCFFRVSNKGVFHRP